MGEVLIDSTAASTEQQADFRFGGESAGYWTQTGLIFVTAVLAFAAILSSRAIERRKSSAQSIFESSRDAELTRGLRRIAALHHDVSTNMGSLASKSREDEDDAKLIRYVLNHYEYVSSAIQKDIFDEKSYKQSCHGTVVSLYNHTKPFINQIRSEFQRPTLYQELEWLACRWKDAPLKKKATRVQV